MQSPVQITFRGIPHSEFVETKIREKVEKLEHYYPHITSCHVIVDAEHHHHHKGNLYDIRIDINVPDKEIVVSQKNMINMRTRMCMLQYVMHLMLPKDSLRITHVFEGETLKVTMYLQEARKQSDHFQKINMEN